jgi:hypothetical protein
VQEVEATCCLVTGQALGQRYFHSTALCVRSLRARARASTSSHGILVLVLHRVMPMYHETLRLIDVSVSFDPSFCLTGQCIEGKGGRRVLHVCMRMLS